MLYVLGVFSNEPFKLEQILVVKLDIFTISLKVFKLLLFLVTAHHESVCLYKHLQKNLCMSE